VLSAGTADGDGQIALSFLHILRQRKIQECGQPIDELPRRRMTAA
jgi:hypothetical protein